MVLVCPPLLLGGLFFDEASGFKLFAMLGQRPTHVELACAEKTQ